MNDLVLEALNRAADEVTSEDIDAIIAYYRKDRVRYERGEKPKKEGEEEDIMSVIKVQPKGSPGFVRRV